MIVSWLGWSGRRALSWTGSNLGDPARTVYRDVATLEFSKVDHVIGIDLGDGAMICQVVKIHHLIMSPGVMGSVIQPDGQNAAEDSGMQQNAAFWEVQQ